MSQILAGLLLKELQQLEPDPRIRAALIADQTRMATAIGNAISTYLSTAVIIPPTTIIPASGPGPHTHLTLPNTLKAP